MHTERRRRVWEGQSNACRKQPASSAVFGIVCQLLPPDDRHVLLDGKRHKSGSVNQWSGDQKWFSRVKANGLRLHLFSIHSVILPSSICIFCPVLHSVTRIFKTRLKWSHPVRPRKQKAPIYSLLSVAKRKPQKHFDHKRWFYHIFNTFHHWEQNDPIFFGEE